MGTLRGESEIDLPDPVAKVWEFLVDVQSAPRWQGGLKSLTATEYDVNGLVSAATIEVDAKLRMVTAQVSLSYQPLTRLQISQSSGDLRSIDSAWELEDLGDQGTHVKYYADVDLGRIGLLLRGPIVELLRQQLAGNRCRELQRALELSS